MSPENYDIQSTALRSSRNVHGNRTRVSTLVLAVIAAYLAMHTVACTKKHDSFVTTKPIVLTMPLRLYARAINRASNTSHTDLELPTVDVYDQHGVRVYHSSEPLEGARVLQELAAGSMHEVSLATPFLLSSLVKELPGLSQEQQAAMSKAKEIVVAVSIRSCADCAVQDSSLEASLNALSARSIQVLQIRVSPPDATPQ
jgi:hypothetical protein